MSQHYHFGIYLQYNGSRKWFFGRISVVAVGLVALGMYQYVLVSGCSLRYVPVPRDTRQFDSVLSNYGVLYSHI